MTDISRERDLLKRKQNAAQKAHDRMLEALMGFAPTQDLRVSDVKFIADYARTIAFDAIKETHDD